MQCQTGTKCDFGCGHCTYNDQCKKGLVCGGEYSCPAFRFPDRKETHCCHGTFFVYNNNVISITILQYILL